MNILNIFLSGSQLCLTQLTSTQLSKPKMGELDELELRTSH